jgi:tetratricopeptide (TPR) repeat protein
MIRRALLLGMGIWAAQLSAQTTTGTGTASGTPTTGIGTKAPAPSTPGGSTSTTKPPTSTDISRPIFISGKVVMADGSPVPQNVTIQRVCSGTQRTVAYTDNRGRFSFQWGQAQSIVSDASDSGFGSRNSSSLGGFSSNQSTGVLGSNSNDSFGSMTNCELRANLGGYTSDTLNLYNRTALDGSDVGIIVLRRIAGVEGTSVSASSLMAPKDAKKAYERGLQSLMKSKPDEAAKDFEKAVSVYPKYADAWVNLGKARILMKDNERGGAAMLKAIEADPKLVAPYLELGLLSARQEKWEESNQYLERAVKLDPVGYPQAWYTGAVAKYNLKKYDEAEKSARQAVKLDVRHVNPREQYLLGLILEAREDYVGAAAEFNSYVQYSPHAADAPQVQEEIRRIEKMLGEAKRADK